MRRDLDRDTLLSTLLTKSDPVPSLVLFQGDRTSGNREQLAIT
jgi:hypothetical protein